MFPKIYLLIEHPECCCGNCSKRLRMFAKAEQREVATIVLLNGGLYENDEQREQCTKQLAELAENGILHFEGDPPIQWIDADVQDSGAVRIALERQRQVNVEGWSAEGDDRYINGELRDAAIAYLMVCDDHADEKTHQNVWPWDEQFWKPGSILRNLEKAGALIAAEYDRLLRTEGR